MTDLSSDDIPLATPIVDEEAAMDVEALLLDRSSVLVIIGAHTNSIKTYQPVKNKNENTKKREIKTENSEKEREKYRRQ